MKMLTKAGVAFDYLLDLLAYLAQALLTFVVLAVSVEIIARYILNYSIKGVVEITEYSLLAITFIGAAWLLKREGHVKVDLILSRVTPRAQTTFNTTTSIIGAIICLIIAWYGGYSTWHHFQLNIHTETILRLPKAPLIAIIPLGSLLLFIQFLRRTYKYLVKPESTTK